MSQLTFGSLFAGIGGFDLGLENSGCQSAWQSERDKNCLSVLQRHWPDVARITDVRDVDATRLIRPDIVTAGWPCQGNSVAGLRAGLADDRSGLWSEVVRVLREFSPRWFLGENVPGILSVNGGRDWLACLRDLAALGYGFAYRVLDAQWFGLAQRRQRVFVVGCLGEWRRAAEILFERESLPWNPAPRREAGARVAAGLTRGTESRGKGGYAGRRQEDDTNIVVARSDTTREGQRLGDAQDTLIVTHTLTGEGHDASEDGSGRGVPLTVVPIDMRQASRGDKMTNNRSEGACSGGAPGTGIGEAGDPSATVGTDHPPAIAYQCHGSNVGEMGTLRAGNGNETGGVPFCIQERAVSENESNGPQGKGYQEGQAFTLEARQRPQSVANLYGVRRLTPRECERLQGFPDDWTRYGHDGNEFSDSPRYRMIGNAVPPPMIQWIGRRIVALTNHSLGG